MRMVAMGVVAVLLGSPGLARADDDSGVEVTCVTEDLGGFTFVKVHLNNPWASPLAYRVTVVATSGDQRWTSPELAGTLRPGDTVERSFRPFGQGMTVTTCTAQTPGDSDQAPPGLAVGRARARVGSAPARARAASGHPPLERFRRQYDDRARGIGAFFVGAGAAVAFAFLGGALGSNIDSDCRGEFCGLAGIVIGAYIGYTLGFPLGFYAIAQHPDSDSSLGATIGLSLVGGIFGVFTAFAGDGGLVFSMWLPPLCSMGGFYATHKHTPAAAPSGALLDVRDGAVALGVPLVQWRRVDGAEVTTVPLIGGRF